MCARLYEIDDQSLHTQSVLLPQPGLGRRVTGIAARRDDLLEQIRALPLEDCDYIEIALIREAYEQGRRTESPGELAEIKQRAVDALRARE